MLLPKTLLFTKIQTIFDSLIRFPTDYGDPCWQNDRMQVFGAPMFYFLVETGSNAWPSLSLPIHSKLTRESGTDFPIPAVPGVADNETEKLIREKDEEVRHADHESGHNCDRPVQSEPPAYPESPPHLIGDTAL